MEGPLSVALGEIYMVKTENDVVLPSKPIFYQRFVFEIYSRPKLGDNLLFNRLNNYNPSIKLIIELNPRKLLDTKLTKPKNPTFTTMDLQYSKTL